MFQEENAVLKRIFIMQLVAGFFGLLVLLVVGRIEYALSYVFGVVLMTANGYWLASRLAKTGGLSIEAGQRSLYAGAAIRFVSLIAGLLLAHLLGFHLLLVAAGMFIAQAVVFMVALVGLGRDQNNQKKM